jgi:replicative DNA helicase
MNINVAFADENTGAEIQASALHNIQAEQVLLGAIINQRAALSKVENIITAEDFFDPAHQDLYAKCLSIRDEGGLLTFTIVKATLGAYGAHALGGRTVNQYAALLAAEEAYPDEVIPLARAIREMAQRRGLDHIGTALKEMAEDAAPITDTVAAAMAALDTIAASRSAPHTRPVMIGDAAREVIEQMQDAIANPDHMPGLTSGLRSIDNMTGGFQRGDFHVLAGRPGMGKSALAITTARLQAEAGHNVLFFSLEMNRHDITRRAVADAIWNERDPIKYRNMKLGKVSPEQQQRVTEAALAFAKLPIKIDPQDGLTLSRIAARARKEQQKLERLGQTLDAVYVDHMHIVAPSNRYQGRPVQEVTEISNGLKALAKELNVPVVALAQLNRGVESRDNRRPAMSDLRESGAIEQDADVILMMFRESYYLNTPAETPAMEMDRLSRLAVVEHRVEVNIVKQRGGETGVVNLYCDIGCNVFRDLDRRSVR